MQVFDAAATHAALPFDALISALRERFAAGCEVPPRHVHDIVNPLGEAGQDAASRRLTSLIMPAWIPGRYYGVKIINIAPGNARRGLPGLHASYLLFDARTGAPLAQIDGDALTVRRTVAASALAGSYLARADARHLLLVGAGRIGALLPAAWRAVRPIEQVSVWARRPEAAQALAARLQAQGLNAQARSDLAAACGEADIVSCATLATEPVVRGAWLAPGAHLDLIGSFTPATGRRGAGARSVGHRRQLSFPSPAAGSSGPAQNARMTTTRRQLCLAASALLAGAACPARAQRPAGAACPPLLAHRFPRLQDDAPQDLCQYAGQVLLVVNTASYCGFTRQYEGLEARTATRSSPSWPPPPRRCRSGTSTST